jgi:hypothetical protein
MAGEIRVIDNMPRFIPPSSVDIHRTPRRGGRLPILKLEAAKLFALDSDKTLDWNAPAEQFCDLLLYYLTTRSVATIT